MSRNLTPHLAYGYPSPQKGARELIKGLFSSRPLGEALGLMT